MYCFPLIICHVHTTALFDYFVSFCKCFKDKLQTSFLFGLYLILVLFGLVWLFETEFLCSSSCLGALSVKHAGLELRDADLCLCLPSVGIKGISSTVTNFL